MLAGVFHGGGRVIPSNIPLFSKLIRMLWIAFVKLESILDYWKKDEVIHARNVCEISESEMLEVNGSSWGILDLIVLPVNKLARPFYCNILRSGIAPRSYYYVFHLGGSWFYAPCSFVFPYMMNFILKQTVYLPTLCDRGSRVGGLSFVSKGGGNKLNSFAHIWHSMRTRITCNDYSLPQRPYPRSYLFEMIFLYLNVNIKRPD